MWRNMAFLIGCQLWQLIKSGRVAVGGAGCWKAAMGCVLVRPVKFLFKQILWIGCIK